jgi:hypothetical protein
MGRLGTRDTSRTPSQGGYVALTTLDNCSQMLGPQIQRGALLGLVGVAILNSRNAADGATDMI